MVQAKTDDTAAAFVRTNAEGKSWTVGNAFVEREIRFDPKLGLYTASWRHKVTGTDFMRRRWEAGNTEVTSSRFRWTEILLLGRTDLLGNSSKPRLRELAPSGESLIINLRAKTKPIEVTIFYAVYDAHPVVRKWIAITNRGTDSRDPLALEFREPGHRARVPPTCCRRPGFTAPSRGKYSSPGGLTTPPSWNATP